MPLGRVLVVDDERQVGAALRDALVEFGYIVKNAASGREALGLIGVFHPDVVLLDVMMPGMTGDEVLDHIHQAHPRVAVVMVTALEDEDRARRLLARGAFDYIRKPFDLTVLERVVAAALVSRRPRDAGS